MRNIKALEGTDPASSKNDRYAWISNNPFYEKRYEIELVNLAIGGK